MPEHNYLKAIVDTLRVNSVDQAGTISIQGTIDILDLVPAMDRSDTEEVMVISEGIDLLPYTNHHNITAVEDIDQPSDKTIVPLEALMALEIT